MTTQIDLTKDDDYFGKAVLAQNLLKDIAFLRKDVTENRDIGRWVTYEICFYAKTPILAKNDQFLTEDGDVFVVNINARTIYPTQVGEKFRIQLRRGGQLQDVDFVGTYTGQYCVVEAIGILVAEQIRFNTLDLLVAEEAKKEFPDRFVSKTLFKLMVDQYLTQVYRNWKNATQDPTILPPGVKVLVPYQS